MTTRSAPELVDAVYDVLRKYLECAVGESSRMQAMIRTICFSYINILWF